MRLATKQMSSVLIWVGLSLLGLILSGCAAGLNTAMSPEKVEPAKTQKAAYPVQPAARDKKGSLWQDNGPLSELFINPKARNVGDIVTIHVVESSSATNKAETNTSRDSSLTAGLEHFFNAEKRYPSDHPFFNPFSSTAVKGGLKSDFAGAGTTKRSGDLTAYITARVTEVLPNGNLLIIGTREVMINNENQLISLSGVIRQRDISSENVILSTYISDARIAYSGTGVVNDRQRPGWMTRILDVVWPF